MVVVRGYPERFAFHGSLALPGFVASLGALMRESWLSELCESRGGVHGAFRVEVEPERDAVRVCPIGEARYFRRSADQRAALRDEAVARTAARSGRRDENCES